MENSSKGFEIVCFRRRIEAIAALGVDMSERFLPTEDPVLESVLRWTGERDAQDVRRLLEWLPEARSSRERKALLDRVRSLLAELESALDGLETLN